MINIDKYVHVYYDIDGFITYIYTNEAAHCIHHMSIDLLQYTYK